MRNFRIFCLAWLLIGSQASADFDPGGRRRPSGAGKTRTLAPRTQPSGPDRKPPAPPKPKEARADKVGRLLTAALERPLDRSLLERVLRELPAPGELEAKLVELDGKGGEAGARANLLLCRIALGKGQREQALARIARARELAPDLPEPLLLEADLLSEDGRKSEALQSLELAESRSSGTQKGQILRRLRDDALLADDLPRARSHQERVSSLEGDSLLVRLELPLELVRLSRWAPAESELSILAKASGPAAERFRVALLWVRALLELGRYAEARAALASAEPLAGVHRPEFFRVSLDLLEREGDTSRGLAELEKKARGTEDLLLIARTYQGLGKTSEAERLLTRILKKEPRHTDARLLRLTVLEQRGDLAVAHRELELLLADHPSDPTIALRLLESHQRRGDTAALGKAIEALLTRTKEPEVLSTLLPFATAAARPDLKLRILGELEKGGTMDTEALVTLGREKLASGDPDAAEQVWRRMVESRPQDARAMLRYAEVLLDHDRLSGAAAAFEKAQALAGPDPEVHRGYALGLERLLSQSKPAKNPDLVAKTLAAWDQLIALYGASQDPKVESARAEARRHLIRIARETGTLPAELRRLRARFEAKPPDLEAGRRIALAEERAHSEASAAATYEAILRAAPDDRAALLELSRLQVALGHSEQALPLYERLARLYPKERFEFLSKASALAVEAHDDERALRYAEQAVKAAPERIEAWLGLAQLGEKLGRSELVRSSLGSALERAPEDLPSLLALLGLEKKSGRFSHAAELFVRITRLSAAEPLLEEEARKLISFLETKALLKIDSALTSRPYRATDALGGAALRLEILDQAEHRLKAPVPSDTHQELADRGRAPALLLLSSSRPRQRNLALRRLSLDPHPATISALLSVAKTQGDSELRAQALHSITGLLDPGALDSLDELLAAPTLSPTVAEAAAQVLLRQSYLPGAPRSLFLRVARHLKHENASVRLALLLSLLRRPEWVNSDSVSLAQDWLRSSHADPRAAAASRLLLARKGVALDSPNLHQEGLLACAELHQWQSSKKGRPDRTPSETTSLEATLGELLLAPENQRGVRTLGHCWLAAAGAKETHPRPHAESTLDAELWQELVGRRANLDAQHLAELTRYLESALRLRFEGTRESIREGLSRITCTPFSCRLDTLPSALQLEQREAIADSVLQALRPDLEELLSHEDLAIARHAAQLVPLGEGDRAARVFRLLAAQLESNDPTEVRGAVASLLRRLNSSSSAALASAFQQATFWPTRQILVQQVKHYLSTRTHLSPEGATGLMSILRQAEKDPHPLVRNSAQE